MDLFDQTPPTDYDYEQDALQKAMLELWEADKATVAQRRIIPDWIGEPEPLSKDRAALLEYLYENGCIYWQSGPSKEKITIAKLIGYSEHENTNKHPSFDFGLPDMTIAIANAKAIIDDCEKSGLIEAKLYRGRKAYELTQSGEYALEDFMIERELGFL
jgi:hypothetical protein